MKIQNTPPMCSFLSDLTVLNIINGYNAFSFFINLQPKLQFTLIYHMQMLAPCPILLLLFLLTPLLSNFGTFASANLPSSFADVGL